MRFKSRLKTSWLAIISKVGAKTLAVEAALPDAEVDQDGEQDGHARALVEQDIASQGWTGFLDRCRPSPMGSVSCSSTPSMAAAPRSPTFSDST